MPGGRLARDRQRSGQVAGADREAVHGRAAKRRQIDAGDRGLGEHSARGVADRHGFRSERPGVLQDEPDRVVEREEVAHRGG